MNKKNHPHPGHSTPSHPEGAERSLLYRMFDHPVSSRLTVGDILFQGFFRLLSLIAGMLGKLSRSRPDRPH